MNPLMHPRLTIRSRATQLHFVAHHRNHNFISGELPIAESAHAFVIQRMPITEMIACAKDR